MSTDTLAAALSTIGLPGRVEAHGGLAIFTATDPAHFTAMRLDAALRAKAVALATQHGFAMLALELPPDIDGRATVSSD